MGQTKVNWRIFIHLNVITTHYYNVNGWVIHFIVPRNFSWRWRVFYCIIRYLLDPWNVNNREDNFITTTNAAPHIYPCQLAGRTIAYWILLIEVKNSISAENINNGGGLSLSPPHTISQRETGTQVSQCYSGPPSPCGTSSTPSPTASPAPPPGSATLDPNWQATKPTVRERNAAMFNNQLMADITFVVGSPGEKSMSYFLLIYALAISHHWCHNSFVLAIHWQI